jgi:hypothetical protein
MDVETARPVRVENTKNFVARVAGCIHLWPQRAYALIAPNIQG